MRTGPWLVFVSAALFVSSIAFVIAGARATRLAPAQAAPAVQLKAVATVKQIMNGIVVPASTVVYESVATNVTASGIEEVVPKNDEEWATLAANAAALAEAGNLLLMDGHAVDTGQWVAITREFITASTETIKAAEAKSPEAVLTAGSTLNETCDKCHERYQRQ
jgi:hypothetical protein